MSTATVSDEPTASGLLAESQQLLELGFPTAAATTARTAMEVAIIERLGDLGRETSRSPIKDRLKILGRHTAIVPSRRRECWNLFFMLSKYTHGRTRNAKHAKSLIDDVGGVITAIAES